MIESFLTTSIEATRPARASTRARSQFDPLEETLAAAGFAVWPLVEYEADDGLAAAAALAAADRRVERVWICTPDKDLAQCVSGTRVVQLDRRQRATFDAAGVRGKFGVDPASIPDYLALVGDSADGFPGLPGWGAKSAAAVIGHYGHPRDPGGGRRLGGTVRSAAKLAATLGRSAAALPSARHAVSRALRSARSTTGMARTDAALRRSPPISARARSPGPPCGSRRSAPPKLAQLASRAPGRAAAACRSRSALSGRRRALPGDPGRLHRGAETKHHFNIFRPDAVLSFALRPSWSGVEGGRLQRARPCRRGVPLGEAPARAARRAYRIRGRRLVRVRLGRRGRRTFAPCSRAVSRAAAASR